MSPLPAAPPPTAADTPIGPPAPPTLGEAVRFWLHLGCVSFGGPAGQIALMHAELVERRRWISNQRFVHALNYCMLLPGPEAQQLATYIGWLLHRSVGGVAAGGLFVLPSLLLLIVLSAAYLHWGALGWVAAVFAGVKPAVAAIVVHAAWRIGKRVLTAGWLWGLAGLSLLAMLSGHVPFPMLIGVAAAVGWAVSVWLPSWLPNSHADASHARPHSPSATRHPPALIDDDTPPPAHARFSRTRLLTVLATGAALWALPMGVLWGGLGWSHTFTQMAWFFTQAALLTFGGAYAVLPYVMQAAVYHYGWLTPGQMMDGLALGETTPGPLIMVVTFVGFVGGYTHAPWGPEATLAAGTVAALLVTWFTFLPSFIFILAGGPLVESTHGNLRLAGPLTAVTATVVGVVVHLAWVFGTQVGWPHGLHAAPDALALCVGALAAVALFRFQRSVMEVIGCAALLGLVLSRW